MNTFQRIASIALVAFVFIILSRELGDLRSFSVLSWPRAWLASTAIAAQADADRLLLSAGLEYPPAAPGAAELKRGSELLALGRSDAAFVAFKCAAFAAARAGEPAAPLAAAADAGVRLVGRSGALPLELAGDGLVAGGAKERRMAESDQKVADAIINIGGSGGGAILALYSWLEIDSQARPQPPLSLSPSATLRG